LVGATTLSFRLRSSAACRRPRNSRAAERRLLPQSRVQAHQLSFWKLSDKSHSGKVLGPFGQDAGTVAHSARGQSRDHAHVHAPPNHGSM
jgi:hypothetical protein